MNPTLKSLDYSILQQCMHCGMCLPTCPTYVETKNERHSPRGRIALMRAIADGDLDAPTREFAEEMYYCLGCLACQSACPAGVDYATMLETARVEVEEARLLDSTPRKFWRWLTIQVLFTNPKVFHLGARLIQLQQIPPIRRIVSALLPSRLRELEKSSPKIVRRFSSQLIDTIERPAPDPDSYSATSKPARTVALLTGCVQDVAFSHINRDTADALLANDCEVVTPGNQPCCGSLHAHNGAIDLARDLARRNIDLFSPLEQYDAIITNAGGCGPHLKHYASLLAHDLQYVHQARIWDDKVRDIHEYLVEIGFRPPKPNTDTSGEPKSTVAYHASCHLHHGQHVTDAPFEILRAIPGINLVPLPEHDWCCGSAGIYSITHPKQSGILLDRKLDNIRQAFAPTRSSSGSDSSGEAASGSSGTLAASSASPASDSSGTLALANPGCHLQIENGLAATPDLAHIQVQHSVSLLAQAYRDEPARKPDT